MFVKRLSRRSRVAAAVIAVAAASANAQYVDVLHRAPRQTALAATSQINALATAGGRLIGAGQRGHIVYSDDGGDSWRQATVPLSSDLTAIHFPTMRHGWAVGHDGVVLHSQDGGASWRVQLDGYGVIALMRQAYATALGPPLDIERFAADGPDKPLLDVWFENERQGTVVGAFGLILRTEDGGATWQPWLHRTENPQGLHLYALRPVAGALFVVGEQGLVLRQEAAGGSFRALRPPYNGTFFGVLGAGREVIVHGLRGNAYRSSDRGATWHKLETGVLGNLNAGLVDAQGGIHLATQTVQIVSSRDGGKRFTVTPMQTPMSAAALALSGERLAIAGRRGVRLQPPP